MQPRSKPLWRAVINPFDLVVLAGGLVNLVVVVCLVSYWVVRG